MTSSPDSWAQFRHLRDELKGDWATLWKTKLEDRVTAEGISSQEFMRLFVNSGEILFASRDFKPISFREIIERHLGSDVAGKVDPDPSIGGWGKFIRENLPVSKKASKRERPAIKFDTSQQQRKHGCGWLNKAKTLKKASCSEYGY